MSKWRIREGEKKKKTQTTCANVASSCYFLGQHPTAEMYGEIIQNSQA